MAKRKPLTDEEGEVRELTLADFRRMKPIREVDPGMLEAVAEWRKKGGRPKSEAPKVHIGFRLAADLVASIKATGKGYNARVEKALREAFMKTATSTSRRTTEALPTPPTTNKTSKRSAARRWAQRGDGPRTFML